MPDHLLSEESFPDIQPERVTGMEKCLSIVLEAPAFIGSMCLWCQNVLENESEERDRNINSSENENK